MKNKITLIVISIALLVALVAIFLLFSNSTSEIKNEESVIEKTENPQTETTTSLFEARGRGSVEDLMGRSENLECVIIYTNSDLSEEKSEGTLFTSRNRMRGDFETNSDGMNTVGSMIINDNVMYSWSEIDGEKFGMKVNLDELQKYKEDNGGDAVDAREPVSLEDEVSFDCKKCVNIDNSVFVPPSDVIFRDFGDVINTGMEFGNIYEGGPEGVNQCELCEAIPAGTDRNECLAAFGC